MRKALFYLGLVVTILVALGLATLSSAGEANGLRIHKDAYHFIKHQAVFLTIGIGIVLTAAKVDYHIWRNRPWLAWIGLGVVFLLLLAVFPPLGRKINGSYRWINLGVVNLQPSEFAKLMTVIAVAVWMDRVGVKVCTFKFGILVPALLIGAMAGPILFETDFGSVMVVGLVGTLVMLVAGAPFGWWCAMCGTGLVGVGAKLLSNENRMARIAAWLGIRLDVGVEVLDEAAQRARYQVEMALVAIKNGGVFGAGLGESMQKQLYLPEAHTDFIFAVGAEEAGLIFSTGVVILFLLFFVLSIVVATKASDRFGRYLVVGMGFIVFFQAMFNIGVVCDALPTKGMALPFFSYGGTNIMSTCFAVGTIFSVGIHSGAERRRAIRHSVRT